MSIFNPLSHAFGLDLGDRSFKVVQIVRRRSKHPPSAITAWGSVTVPEGVMDNGDIVDLPRATELLKQLLGSVHGRLHGRTVVASLPEARTFLNVIRVTRGLDDAALAKAVEEDVRTSIPLPSEEIYVDWQRIPRPAHTSIASEDEDDLVVADPTAEFADDGADTVAPKATDDTPVGADAAMDPSTEHESVLVAAVPRAVADKVTALLEGAGLVPAALEIEGMAITRAIVPDAKLDTASLAILDIGATRSSLVIYDEGAPRISIGIPISGNGITGVVAERLGLPHDDAEKLKIDCGLDVERCEDRMWNILLPFIDEMSERIRNALRFYRVSVPSGRRIERVYLCGGGAYFREIDSVLSRKLGIKVRRGNALANVDAALPKDFPDSDALGYATAVGLGLRAAEEAERHDRDNA